MDSSNSETESSPKETVEEEVPKKRASGKRRRKRQPFRGNQNVNKARQPRPQPKPSTSEPPARKKLSTSARKISQSPPRDCVDDTWSGYSLMDVDLLLNHLKENCRCVCGGTLKFSEENQGGLHIKFIQKCENRKCKKIVTWENSKKIGQKKNISDINRRSVVATRALGLGHTGLKKFCSHMELPPPVQVSSFYSTLKTVHECAKDLAGKSMREAAKLEVELTGSTDIDMSGDGTWHTRGHSSQTGVCTAVAEKCGKVVDVEILTKSCWRCSQYVGDRTSEEYEEWYLAHAPFCQQNHYGSSSKMEADGMVSIFKRSIEVNGVRYKTYIGDGDSATFVNITEANPYPDLQVVKKECIGHIEKRVTKQLETFKTNHKTEKLSDGKGLGGQGRLTKQAVHLIQRYYGNAIRDNSHLIEAMKKAIWAIYHHLSSTDEEFNHTFCPEGDQSWCKYQVAVAKGTSNDFKHSKPAIAPICIKACHPVFENLSSDSLLERCIGAFSQNSNESFHNIIWNYAPKSKACGREVAELAVYCAVLQFNGGQKKKLDLYDELKLTVGKRLTLERPMGHF